MYGTIIIQDSIQQIFTHLNSNINNLDDSGNIFLLARTEYLSNGDVSFDFLDLIDYATKLGLQYVNTIVAPMNLSINTAFPDNVLYIVWLAKNKNHFFNKDTIRESHIWKDVEWGKRAKNYNTKGKDPGNVWIPTKDDGKAHITEHILLSFSDIINRINKCTKQPNLETLLITNNQLKDLYLDENIKVTCVENNYTELDSRSFVFYDFEKSVPNNITANVIWGTSEDMTMLQNNSVNVVITSPPYWDLKDYFKEGQIGQESYETYLNRLNKVWQGCYNKLSDTGSLWLNINIRTKKGNVILIPKDFVSQCKKIGFHYKGILIWHKSSGIPTHDKNIVDRHEYVLVFSKSENLYINSKIADFKDYKNEAINGGLFWNINRKAGSVGKQFIHPAIYPNDLVSRILMITTKENDIVLDPFLGSGTTLISAVQNGRNCIGFEYNEGFKDLIIDRVSNETQKVKFLFNI